MCQRYTITAAADKVKSRFNVDVPGVYSVRYNAAPTQVLPIITNDDSEGVSFFYWGLIPSMAKNKSISPKLYNARIEDVTKKASFKYSLRHRRCLVISDGYYDWKITGKKSKVPYRVTLNNQEPYAMAGLWEEYEDDENETVHTFTIVTVPSNDLLSDLNDYMPAILKPEDEKGWLNNELDLNDHLKMLTTYDAGLISKYTVSPMINRVDIDSAELIKNCAPADQFGNYTLFD